MKARHSQRTDQKRNRRSSRPRSNFSLESLEKREMYSVQPLGPGFIANTIMQGAQHYPSIAMDHDDSFAIVWQDSGLDSDGNGIYARRFDSSGNPEGNQFRANTDFVGRQERPGISFRPDGDLTITWRDVQKTGGATVATEMHARDFSDDGPREQRTVVDNSEEPYVGQLRSATGVFHLDSGEYVYSYKSVFGDWVVEWQDSEGHETSRFSYPWNPTENRSEARFSFDQLRNTYYSFVMSRDVPDVGAVEEKFVRRFDKMGNPIGLDILLETLPTDRASIKPNDIQVILRENGNFMCLWGGADQMIRGRHYSSSGAPISEPFDLLKIDSEFIYEAEELSTGNFVFAWQTAVPWESDIISVQEFDMEGTPEGAKYVLTDTPNYAAPLDLAATSNGGFVLTWAEGVPGAKQHLGDKANVHVHMFTTGDPNRAPDIADIPDIVAEPGESLSLEVEAVDPDGDDLTYSIVSSELDDLAIDPSTGQLTGTAPVDAGDFDVIVQVTDNGVPSASSRLTFTVNVAPPHFVLDGGILTVTGTNGRDTIEIKRSRIVSNFGEFDLGTSRLQSIIVNAGPGNDRVMLRQLPATVSAFVDGGKGNDVLVGGEGHDTLVGGEGGDQLSGRGGNDELIGDEQTGNSGTRDIIYGGSGNDSLTGGAGDDRLVGMSDHDLMSGSSGNDALFGRDGNDTIHGGDGNDNLIGGRDDDHLSGEDGNDRLFGSMGNDWLEGGVGQDLLRGGSGSDSLNGAFARIDDGSIDLIFGQADFDSLLGRIDKKDRIKLTQIEDDQRVE